MSDKDALQKLTEAGEIQAAMERIATLEAALHLAFAKMDRARDILTEGEPTINRNWGMLETGYIKHGLGWPIDREALAGNPAPRLTDAPDDGKLWSFFRAMLSQGSGIWLDHVDKKYEAYSARLDVAASERVGEFRAIEAKVRGE